MRVARTGLIAVSGDCEDDDPTVNPAAREVCNEIDDDCDGQVDDEDAGVDPTTFTRWHRDIDGDGYGDASTFVDQCTSPPGALTDGQDCNDARPGINPDGHEICNRIDDDCDGLTDDFDPDIDPAGQTYFFADTDGDGYGDPDNQALACESQPGYGVDNADDCDDTNYDATIDQWWYHDYDGDGFGTGAQVVFQCLDPGGDLAPGLHGVDCDDFDPFENPDTPEACFDGVDQNCNQIIDCDDSDCIGVAGCLLPCADLDLGAQLPVATNGSTVGEGDDSTPGCGFSLAEEVAFQCIPPATGNYIVDTFGSAYDTILSVRDGCNGPELGCNDDSGGGRQSEVRFQATAGVPLIIVVDGYDVFNGDFVLNIR